MRRSRRACDRFAGGAVRDTCVAQRGEEARISFGQLLCMTVDRPMDRDEQRPQHVQRSQDRPAVFTHATKFSVAHSAEERLGVMGKLRDVGEGEEGRRPLERVERAKDGVDRSGVVWLAREPLKGEVRLLQQVAALHDKIEQERAIGIGRQE